MNAKRIKEVEFLPIAKNNADFKMLEGASANEALAIAFSVLTVDQKNIVLNDGNGGRVTLAEFIEFAVAHI